MRVACCAIVGKENNPLYIQTWNQDDELKFHFIVHTSLDIIEEKSKAKEKQNALGKVKLRQTFGSVSSFFFFFFFKDCFLGVLYPTEDFNVYGYITNSGAKLILVLDDSGIEARYYLFLFIFLFIIYIDFFFFFFFLIAKSGRL
jgi:hypothetical protein